MRPHLLALGTLALAAGAAAFWFNHRSGKTAAPTVTVSAPAAPSAIPAELSALLASLEKSSAGADTTIAAPPTPLDRELSRTLRAIRARPESADAWLRLGDALTQRSRDTLDFSLYSAIEKIYLHARRLDPQAADALAGLAWAAGACHRFDDSVAWAALALKADPDLPAAHGILGDAAVELGRHAEAERHYQRMLDLRPDLGSYSRAAHLLYLQGNATRALALMRQALRAGGENPEHTAWCVAQLAAMLCREGAARAAHQLVATLLARAPNNPLLLAASGQTHAALGDTDAALAAYEESRKRAPQHTTLAALHDLHLAAGRLDDAARMAAEVEKLHAALRSQKIHGGEGQLARFYADRAEKLEEAIRLAEFEQAHHQTVFTADTLAWAYFRAGRIDDAAKLLPAMLGHRAPDPAILYHAGLIEEARGQRVAAQRHLYAALSRDPRFNPVHAPRAAVALQRLGGAPMETRVAAAE
jgi:tetratricopeptide (TPR) repeat protein